MRDSACCDSATALPSSTCSIALAEASPAIGARPLSPPTGAAVGAGEVAGAVREVCSPGLPQPLSATAASAARIESRVVISLGVMGCSWFASAYLAQARRKPA
ncbi:hypothetical protein [Xanthomonas translucens]|uniref:hypothetical protein n=1 Tax=Xanthomonas campestris pv. translucens TaxID=343 RepID=UPI00200B493B|nr:hypothetical protein [Xanthomonas translucens]UPU49750.1 hypothetical protein MZO50_04720 [Xanthomonas translucens pv. undulosa]